ncbi:MAG TPA: type II toxin-antitoxin system VapC family toxin [Roseiarcus sp.]|nr:type II toxin-antitoxin system VapC family toxin [Roseiarcus sp.]
MFVDASAILAILLDEPDGERLAGALQTAKPSKPVTSVLAAWEAAVGLNRKKGLPMIEAEARILEFAETAGLDIISVTPTEFSAALRAFDRYGRHRYPEADRNKALNLADCFHYACAKSRRMPILHKDAGLALTDAKSAS